VVKPDFIGFLSGEGCLMLDLIPMFLFPMIILLSLEKYLARLSLLDWLS
jgi:hypothetical protein